MSQVARYKQSIELANKEQIKKLQKGINKALYFRKDYAVGISPTDTGEYIRGHDVTEAVQFRNTVAGSNVNFAEDAFGVEFGFRRTEVNWHKGPPRSNATRIYRGVGANVYQRTAADTLNDIQDILSKAMQ